MWLYQGERKKEEGEEKEKEERKKESKKERKKKGCEKEKRKKRTACMLLCEDKLKNSAFSQSQQMDFEAVTTHAKDTNFFSQAIFSKRHRTETSF